MKALKFVETNWRTKNPKKGRVFQLMVVVFEDEKGNRYDWAPKWDDLNEVFNDAPLTELLNSGNSWLSMIETSLRVISIVANSLNQQGKHLKLPEPGDIHKPYISVELKPPPGVADAKR